ncbi:MAG TPA: alpha/beta hydrolase [Candidatus Limnocylindria bacterium]|nr:alpha/beta hydrolase [Candidatus Limnocylindria bacterium]
MREEAVRVAGRLEATLRIPDVEPRAVVVVAHPLPTHGGTMRNPLVASLARAIAARGFYALRFNFRGVGASDGEWTGGVEEWRDVADAVAHARDTFPELPVGVAAYSFGALTTLRWIEKGGHANGIALVGVPLRSVWLAPQELPAVPDGTFIVAAAHDQFGTAEELRRALPRARIAEVKGVDHFFVGKRDEAGRLVAGELARALASTVP